MCVRLGDEDALVLGSDPAEELMALHADQVAHHNGCFGYTSPTLHCCYDGVTVGIETSTLCDINVAQRDR